MDVARYPFLTSDDVSNDLDLLISTNFSYSDQIETQWMVIPQSALLSDGSVTNHLPSALINVALPNQTNSSIGSFLTCSIDARWVMGKYKGAPISAGSWSQRSMEYVQTVDLQATEPFDNSSSSVQMDIDWLQNLTPATSNVATSTSLATILTAMDLTNISNLASTNVSKIVPELVETVIAAVLADGMSRVGYTTLVQAGDLDFYLPEEPLNSIWKRFMTGKYKFPRPSTPGPLTELDWTVEVSGLAFRADSNAYKLALVVLFIHAALAITHTAYVICFRVFRGTDDSFRGFVCNTWDSILGFVVLAARSGAEENAGVTNGTGTAVSTAALFQNTGAGIERYRTMKTQVCIRTKPSRGTSHSAVRAGSTRGNGQQVEILFGRDENTLARSGYSKVEIGKAYG